MTAILPGARTPRTAGRRGASRERADIGPALPVPALLADHVERATRGARTLPGELVSLIAGHPAAAARVLARRVAIGTTGTVDGIGAALAELPVSQVRAAVATGPFESLLDGASGPGGAAPIAIVARTLEIARLSAALVMSLPGGDDTDADAAWTAGILSHIGLSAIDALGGAPDGPSPRFALSHPALGARACRRWRLSERVVEAVRTHADPSPGPGAVARALWLATRIERVRAGAAGMEALVAGGRRCGIEGQDLERVLIGAPAEVHAADDVLTPREHDILLLLADGLVPKQIATELGCTVSTVNNHLHHVYAKLGVPSQARALLVARERGWV